MSGLGEAHTRKLIKLGELLTCFGKIVHYNLKLLTQLLLPLFKSSYQRVDTALVCGFYVSQGSWSSRSWGFANDGGSFQFLISSPKSKGGVRRDGHALRGLLF
ncbi:hypothetical protein D3C85_1488130 [compost metagenome]